MAKSCLNPMKSYSELEHGT